MAQAHFLNRYRSNWLWALSAVVVLLPLMLGQSSVGGCGATVTIPDPDPNTSPDGNINETGGDSDGDGTDDSVVLDSDGDGFSDDVENGSNPGTDPFDPTDNPNNVRDTDGDGCSDYDERTLVGFCDNDPNTQTSTCEVEFFNDDFAYGFDLPTLADLVRFDDKPDFLFNATWELILGNSGIIFSTRVQEHGSQTIAEAEDAVNRLQEANGAEFFTEAPMILSNGDPGFLSVFVSPSPPDVGGATVYYRVAALKHGRHYSANAIVHDSGFTTEAETAMSDAVLSLCIE